MPSSATIDAFVAPALPWSYPRHVERGARTAGYYPQVKRIMDVVVCLVALPVVLVFLLVCTLMLLLESGGPILDSRWCSGRGGRSFRLYRMRTSRAPRVHGPPNATAGSDQPIVGGIVGAETSCSRVGRFLEETGLADLPQIFNVLRGEMSLVGPRAIAHGAGAERLWHTARFDVAPGLVSAAQVMGRAPLGVDEVVRIDIAYIRNESIVLDIRILLQAADLVTRRERYVLKRVLDVVLASLLCILLAPLMLGLAAVIRWETPGPILFRQCRIGRNGMPFQIFKFRTMRVDAEEVLVANPELYREYVENDFKLPLETDPRITPMGRWLRKSSLDELPQLLNVILGDMSLVGPRPVVPAELMHYRDRVTTLLSVLPGVTGAWQVAGRNNVRYPERCDVELEYVYRWSLTRDVVILYKTLEVALTGRGAL